MTTTAMTSSATIDDLLAILDAQCEDYGAMYREGVVQRDCLRNDDLDGLNAVTGRMQALMDRVRLRHADLPADLVRLEREHAEVATRTDCLRRTIQSVLALRDQSDQAARRLMEHTRTQLRQVSTARRASRGYQQQPRHLEARFVDNLR